jgi:hypothetical protein
MLDMQTDLIQRTGTADWFLAAVPVRYDHCSFIRRPNRIRAGCAGYFIFYSDRRCRPACVGPKAAILPMHKVSNAPIDAVAASHLCSVHVIDLPASTHAFRTG